MRWFIFVLISSVLLLLAACTNTSAPEPAHSDFSEVATVAVRATAQPPTTPTPQPTLTHTFDPTALTTTPWPPDPLPTRTPWSTAVPPTATHVPRPSPTTAAREIAVNPTGYDLLFLQANTLYRWPSQTNNIEPLLSEKVIGYVISQDGQRVVVVTQDDNALYSLVLLDLLAHEQRPLLAGVGGVLHYQISPDGRWLAYTLQGASPTGAVEPIPDHGPESGKVYLLSLDTPEAAPIEIGACLQHLYAIGVTCRKLLWSPDSQSLVWIDMQALWRVTLENKRADIIRPVTYFETEDGLWYIHSGNLAPWSPSGRYLEASVIVGPEGGEQVIIDLETAQIVSIPNPSGFDTAGPYLFWLADERLVLLRPAGNTANHQSALQLWQVDEATGVLKQITSTDVAVGTDHWPISPTQFPDGRIGFAGINLHDMYDWSLYLPDLTDPSSFKRVSLTPLQLPAFHPGWHFDTHWLPENTGYFWQDEFEENWYVFLLEDTAYNISATLGEGACCLTWLP